MSLAISKLVSWIFGLDEDTVVYWAGLMGGIVISAIGVILDIATNTKDGAGYSLFVVAGLVFVIVSIKSNHELGKPPSWELDLQKEITDAQREEIERLSRYIDGAKRIGKRVELIKRIEGLESRLSRLSHLDSLTSNLERNTALSLQSLGIQYETQKRFSDCRHKVSLPFDFYFTYEGNQYLIECDGKQHFEAVDYFGGQVAFEQVQLRDGIKTDYCKNNDINLIRVPYHMKSQSVIQEHIINNL